MTAPEPTPVSWYCGRGPCCLPGGHPGPCNPGGDDPEPTPYTPTTHNVRAAYITACLDDQHVDRDNAARQSATDRAWRGEAMSGQAERVAALLHPTEKGREP